MKHLAGLLAVLTLVSSTATAQSGMAAHTKWDISPEYRQVQARGLQMQRHLLLAMADSMPEALYRDRATPIQRDFAQQIRHAAGEAYRVAEIAMRVADASTLPDTTAAFASRAGLEAYINAAYDHLDQWLASQSDQSRNEVIDFFGSAVPRWEVWDEISHYTVWTAGQVVANFRKNGMAPPGFHYFPAP